MKTSLRTRLVVCKKNFFSYSYSVRSDCKKHDCPMTKSNHNTTACEQTMVADILISIVTSFLLLRHSYCYVIPLLRHSYCYVIPILTSFLLLRHLATIVSICHIKRALVACNERCEYLLLSKPMKSFPRFLILYK